MVGFQLRILGKERLPRDLRLMTGFPIIIANMKNRYKLHSFSSTSSNISSASYTPSTYISFTSFQVQMVVTAANTGGCWGEVPPTHMTPTPLQSNTPLFSLFQVEIIVNNPRDNQHYYYTTKAIFDLLLFELKMARLSLKNPATLSSLHNSSA